MTTPLEPPAGDAPLQAAWRDVLHAVTPPGAHLTEDEWVQLASGEADAATRERWADHIEACAECAAIFQAVSRVRDGAGAFDPDAPHVMAARGVEHEALHVLDRSDDALDEARGSGNAAAARSWRLGLAAAAVLALAVGAGSWWRSAAPSPAGITTTLARDESTTSRSAPAATEPLTGDPQPSSAAAASESPSAATPASPVAPASAGARDPRVWAALPAAPAVMLPASLTLVMRGDADPAAATEREAFLRAFGAAIAPYRGRRYDEAARALAEVTEQYPAIVESWFYLGVSHLYADRPAAAVEPLRRAQTSEVVADDARWFSAIALERAGRATEARTTLDALCAAPSSRQRDACSALGR